VQEVTDSFLLQTAEIAGGLFGLFLVGMLFFVETGFRQLGPERGAMIAYFRSSSRIVLILFAIPVLVSLTLVVLDETWSVILFAVLSLALIAANFDTAARMKPVREAAARSTVLLANEIVGTISVVFIVVLPWILGGFDPTREDLTWSILISFGAGFLSLGTLMMSVFDLEMSR
jgi:hypothetical protein